MDKIPQRIKMALQYRAILNKFEGRLIFPVKNPSFYQVLALCISVYYLFSVGIGLRLLIVVAALILDWLDGAAARKYGLSSRAGWMIDVVVDRISEGFIFAGEFFTFEGKMFFTAYIVNIFLSMRSVKSGKHFILPLRFIWMVILLAKVLWK